MSPRTTKTLGGLLLVVSLVVGFTAFAQSFGSFLSPGELAEAHADLDTLGGCLQCHEAGAGIGAALCMDCHEGVRAQVNKAQGFHGSLGQDCESCHSDHKGRDFELIVMEKDTFQHHKTGFALLGEHADVDCEDCHQDEEIWTGLESTCLPCHAEDDDHAPQGGARKRMKQCQDCHEVDPDWAALPLPVTVFDHQDSTQADYPLAGEHAEVECEDCHEELHFVPVASDQCTDCHEDPHHSDFVAGCEDCHEGPQTWAVEGFDHRLTGYALLGRHRSVGCESCHHEDKTKAVPHARCGTCHRDPHRGEFKPRDCDACHDIDRPFAMLDFDHDETAYPLVGEHGSVDCVACHGEGEEQRFTGLAFEDCKDCHDDAHVGFFAQRTCSSCHDETTIWEVDSFDHELTGYALEGEHVDVGCESCHKPDTGPELPHESCQDCHAEASPHNDTVSAETCSDCHTVVSFTELRFDHATTEFPLEKAHQEVACTDCHGEEQFIEAPTTCAGCHEEDRPAAHFEGECGQCHTATVWPQASLGELGHAITGYSLDGSHAALVCADCHDPELPNQRVGSTCSSCHSNDDAHRNMVGDDCASCHNELSWLRPSWTHSQTGYTLNGSHRLASCQDCHATGTAGTPTDCIRCHQSAQPSDSIHQPAFADHCEDCHKTYGWETPLYPH